jgi:uncharacterized protein GlcG (DUF336 family)
MKAKYCLGYMIAGATLLSTAQAQLPTKKVITLQVAERIAEVAAQSCVSKGYNVSVLVVDDAGRMIAFLRSDGADNAGRDIALGKANAVLTMRAPSGPPPNAAPGAQGMPAMAGMLMVQGALPIMVNNDLIGAVAVAGAPGGDKDAACAQAGIDAVKSLLK